MTTKEKLIVFDTTLRDGEQSPGVTFTTPEKLEIARTLSRMGVDVCEAGFPMSSEGDFDAVSRIAKEVGPLMEGREAIGKPMVITGLTRAIERDIQRTYDAVKHAPLHRIHIFHATSDIHLQYKFRISREEGLRRIVAAIRFARTLCDNIEFSPEDAARTDRAFLVEVLTEAIKAGATTLNVPDTVGINLPEEYGGMFKHLIANTSGADKVIWSAHCQNDLGLATANTLAAIQNGVRQVEVTINGIGERAGNTSLEEVIMAIHTHPGDSFPVFHQINTKLIYKISQLVLQTSGMAVQPHKAIVGSNAFAHESGVHQDGVLKHRSTYEIIDPAEVGVPSNSIVLGKTSGRSALKMKLAELGIEVTSDEALLKIFSRFKALADKKAKVTDHDLIAIAEDQKVSGNSVERYVLDDLIVMSGTGVISTATVTVRDLAAEPSPPGRSAVDAATGHGPIQAVFAALLRITHQTDLELRHYEVRSVGGGEDALAKVFVKIARVGGDASQVYSGQGADNDTIHASAKAYLHAINRLVADSDN
ncbi:2-isopropylmalate synthase [Thamnocephalis sphaerospora]|uniref:2-isopropylmalate synthase n=1 Tax=Thamnocephalis sphaerospora TaxID=78915 RepID=A0A4V1IVT4_9FUNG|nr:2-isopropylmalate synthase [Thamnocephalis sphaerospora]|eukprot:RKP05169.1 2-isopropylmalate synthase [Thamnocephalis sphaerospora]